MSRRLKCKLTGKVISIPDDLTADILVFLGDFTDLESNEIVMVSAKTIEELKEKCEVK